MAWKSVFVAAIIMALSSTGARAAKRGLPEQVIPQCFGVNIHFRGDNDKEVKQLADAGFKFIRMDFTWGSTEKEKGKYDFSEYDGLMAALDRHGIRPLFILDYTNKLYDDGLAPYTDEGRKAFAAFAKAAASHFKDRGILWEIWNEPNGGGFWHPKPNPDHYALLANVTAKAIHEADKTATVLAPALAGMDFGYIEQVFKGGVLDNIDVVSVHPYRGQYPETAAADYERLREMIRRYAPQGKQIPIVSGEWGYTDVEMGVELQAQYLVRQFLTNLMSGVKLSIWYDWHDDGQDPNEREHHFGTVYWDFSPKPAYKAVRTLTTQLAGYRFISRLSAENPQDYLLLFAKGSDDYKLVAWTTDAPHQLSTPLDIPRVTLTGIYGDRKMDRVMSDRLKLDVGPDVTYVSSLIGSRRLAVEVGLKVEPTPVKQANAAELPAVVEFTNPLDTPVKAMMALRDPATKRTMDSSVFEVAAKKTARKKLTFKGAWNGNGSPQALLELMIEGMDEPFRRTVAFDTTRRFTVSSAPPANNMVAFYVSNPSGEPFSGRIMLSSGPGMTVAAIAVPLILEKGQTFASINYPVILGDRKQYTYRYTVLDGRNDAVYAAEDRTYKLVEAFDKPDKLKAVMDGSADVEGSAELSLSDPPEKLGGTISCTKLAYRFGKGWKFVRIPSDADLPINGKPREIGVWVYGDKSGNFVRARITDSTGQTFQPHLAAVDWEGWRFVTCPIEPSKMGWWGGANDGIVHWPVKWDTLVLWDSADGKEQSGETYIGPLWLIY